MIININTIAKNSFLLHISFNLFIRYVVQEYESSFNSWLILNIEITINNKIDVYSLRIHVSCINSPISMSYNIYPGHIPTIELSR